MTGQDAGTHRGGQKNNELGKQKRKKLTVRTSLYKSVAPPRSENRNMLSTRVYVENTNTHRRPACRYPVMPMDSWNHGRFSET